VGRVCLRSIPRHPSFLPFQQPAHGGPITSPLAPPHHASLFWEVVQGRDRTFLIHKISSTQPEGASYVLAMVGGGWDDVSASKDYRDTELGRGGCALQHSCRGERYKELLGHVGTIASPSLYHHYQQQWRSDRAAPLSLYPRTASRAIPSHCSSPARPS